MKRDALGSQHNSVALVHDSFGLAFRPAWASAVGAAIGICECIAVLLWTGPWGNIPIRFLLVILPAIFLGTAAGCHRFLFVRSSRFNFASAHLTVQVGVLKFIPLARWNISFHDLAPVEISPVNQNDMAPSWGIFIRPGGWPKAVPICGGMSYVEAAELAAMINYRRSVSMGQGAELPSAESI